MAIRAWTKAGRKYLKVGGSEKEGGEHAIPPPPKKKEVKKKCIDSITHIHE